jgi:hypothetical protein
MLQKAPEEIEMLFREEKENKEDDFPAVPARINATYQLPGNREFSRQGQYPK